MPTHLYCLLPRGSSAATPAGIRSVDVHVAQAWVGDTEQAQLSRDARDAVRATVAHDGVIGQALAQGVTPMPASLADPYEDDAAMQRDIAVHARAIEMAFPAISDMIEMTTIVAIPDKAPAADAPGRGTAYLEQIRSAPARAGVVADRIADSLKERFPTSRRRVQAGTIAVSHLVPRPMIGAYRTLALALASDDYRLVVDGPRAPYSFFLFSPGRGVHGMILAT